MKSKSKFENYVTKLVLLVGLIYSGNCFADLPNANSVKTKYISNELYLNSQSGYYLQIEIEVSSPQVSEVSFSQITTSANYYGDSDKQEKCLVSSHFQVGSSRVSLIKPDKTVIELSKRPIEISPSYSTVWQNEFICKNESIYLNTQGLNWVFRNAIDLNILNDIIAIKNLGSGELSSVEYRFKFENQFLIKGTYTSWYHSDIQKLVFYGLSLPDNLTGYVWMSQPYYSDSKVIIFNKML